jgi:sortase A
MAAVQVRRAVRWVERLLWLLGVGFLVSAGATWTRATIYQLDAKHRWDHLPALPAAAPRVEAPWISESRSPVDSMIGLLVIPRVGLSAAVLEGDDAATLEVAVGHLPDTALPWDGGNTALAAHRDTFFRPIEQVRIGDEMRLATRHGEFEYRVRRLAVVDPDDVWVLNPSAHVGLTLITCYPFRYVGPAPRRYIVQAERTSGTE